MVLPCAHKTLLSGFKSMINNSQYSQRVTKTAYVMASVAQTKTTKEPEYMPAKFEKRGSLRLPSTQRISVNTRLKISFVLETSQNK
jgi:hypothetical protein